MSELTSKTNKDTTSMKWITILTLVNLPGNFVCVSGSHRLSTNQFWLTWRILDVVWNEFLCIRCEKSEAGHRQGLLDLRGNMATTYLLHLSGILVAEEIPRAEGKWSSGQDRSSSIEASPVDRIQEARYFRPRPWIVILYLRAGKGFQNPTIAREPHYRDWEYLKILFPLAYTRSSTWPSELPMAMPAEASMWSSSLPKIWRAVSIDARDRPSRCIGLIE